MEKDLSQVIIDAAKEVHRHLGGPGLLESVLNLPFVMSYLCKE